MLITFSIGKGVSCVYENVICDEMLRKDDNDVLLLLLLLQSYENEMR